MKYITVVMGIVLLIAVLDFVTSDNHKFLDNFFILNTTPTIILTTISMNI